MKKILLILAFVLPALSFAQTNSVPNDTINYMGIRRFDTYEYQYINKYYQCKLEAYSNGDIHNVRFKMKYMSSSCLMTYKSVITQIEKLEELYNITKNLSKPDHDIYMTLSPLYTDGLELTYRLEKDSDKPKISYSYDESFFIEGFKDIMSKQDLTVYIEFLKKMKSAMEEFSKKYGYSLM